MKNKTLPLIAAGFLLGAWQSLGSNGGRTFDELYKMAAKAYENNENEKALELLTQAEQVRPYQIHCYNLRGSIYLKNKNFQKAQENFQKALQIEPQSQMLRYNLAQVYFDQKLYAESKKIFQQLNAENQNDQQIQFRLFLCNLLMNEQSSVGSFLASLKKDTETPLYDYCHAAKEFHNGNSIQAMEFVRSAFRDYSPEQNAIFSYSLVELGYLKGESVGTQPQKTEK